jgi:hypothetical protein
VRTVWDREAASSNLAAPTINAGSGTLVFARHSIPNFAGKKVLIFLITFGGKTTLWLE